MKNKKEYSLYNNKEKEIIYDCASNLEEIKQVSLQYESGYWFQYDVEISEEGSILLWNERPYKGKVKFGSKEDIEALNKEKEEIRKSGKSTTGLNSGIKLV